MRESSADLIRLQELLDASYAAAGAHQLRIHTPERRVGASDLVARLQGMCLLVLATVTADGRPRAGPVDGIFFGGAFHFGSAPDSLRMRHIAARPQVSATHLPGEEFSVTVHGTAALVDLRDARHASLRGTILDIYVPRYGPEWEHFLDTESVYARIDAERMYAFSAPGAG
jgi:nitroimidazol reductase NimA-like FMN-containing flavoprotein (pyridoxamine 5'-phosphate oxidase superfamily)